ncbi:hypothetical protein LshimejAT787_0703780 [Lyophyllum shimeji]|uniref:Uncharacterized protein n=1 Tax=Lyophyllum shimeji TaxID=47721 RepID=A0A9P3PPV4_LYOSH|nr:hypothetical protein LshimejAT787_0703780 [Lyophyllum shimeji]
MDSNATHGPVSPSPVAGDVTSQPIPRFPGETGITLQALNAIGNQLDILQDGQRRFNEAINEVLDRPIVHDILDSQETVLRLDAIEGHLHRLTIEDTSRRRHSGDAFESHPQLHGLPERDRSTSNHNAPRPLEDFRPREEAPPAQTRRHIPLRAHVTQSEAGPSDLSQSLPLTGQPSGSSLVQQLHDILSRPDQIPAFTVERPPPVHPLPYRPAPKPRSASPVSIPEVTLRSMTTFQPSRPTEFRSLQRASQRSGASEAHPQALDTHETDTSHDDAELERELHRVRTERLLAVDARFASDSRHLETSSSHQPSRRRPRLHQRGTPTNAGRARTRDLYHGQLSAPLRGAREGRHIPTSHVIPVDSHSHSRQAGHPPPALSRVREAYTLGHPHLRKATAERPHVATRAPRAAPAEQPSSTWYHPPSHTQPPSQSGAQPTVVQFPPEPLNQAIELLQDIRRGQRAAAEEQREVARYMRELNGWLERATRAALKGPPTELLQQAHSHHSPIPSQYSIPHSVIPSGHIASAVYAVAERAADTTQSQYSDIHHQVSFPFQTLAASVLIR